MDPPFGLRWGETPDKVLDWAEAKRLNVDIRIPGAQPEVRRIRVAADKGPLPGHRAYALEAHYHWGKLFEVTVHYGAPGAKAEAVKSNFEKVRKALAAQHGDLVPNRKESSVDQGVKKQVLSYHVEPVAGLLLMMVYSEMTELSSQRKSARFSLIYRNQNIIPKR